MRVVPPLSTGLSPPNRGTGVLTLQEMLLGGVVGQHLGFYGLRFVLPFFSLFFQCLIWFG